MNLVLDIGNTNIKWGRFDESGCVDNGVSDGSVLETIHEIDTDGVTHCMVAGSGAFDIVEIVGALEGVHVLEMTPATMIPLEMKYETPETLGDDRLANAVAGATMHPGRNVLVIDVGTCVTYDIVTARNEYVGGGISPGLQMRAKALHNFTEKLPLIEPERTDMVVGRSTNESMAVGTYTAMVQEIRGMIDLFEGQYLELRICLTGGDAHHFENDLKSGIFADSILTLKGLNTILEHNAN